MPTRDENIASWTNYDWSQRGDDWSSSWGSSRMLWFRTLLPRIFHFLPAQHVLEIAPGFGRITAFLLDHCERLSGVDITERCVDACRERFLGVSKAEFFRNDGLSLECVPDSSIDFATSWDSLVHAEPAVLESYVRQLARKLVPGGTAFLHHSNLGDLRDLGVGESANENTHWRDPNMGGTRMRDFVRRAGLILDAQELVQWGHPQPIDCFTWFHRPRSGEPELPDGETYLHPSFLAEIEHSGWLHRHAGRAGRESAK
ncbi:MAG: class I SAM-dependent methyltransferase [Planctomycetota bacterium]